MKNKAQLVWFILWSITVPILHFRNNIAAGETDFVGRTVFTAVIFLIPAVIFAFITWFLLKFLAKSLFNKPEITPAISLLTWLIIFAFIYFIPAVN